MGERAAVLQRVLGSRPLRRVAVAFLGFSCAEHAVWVAMTVFAYQQGGTTLAAVIAAVQLLPAAVVAPLASRATDRRGGAWGLWAGYAVQALAMGVTGALLVLEAPPVAAYAGAVVAASAVTFTRPAQAALVPDLVTEPAELTAVNAVTGWLESLSYFAGPAVAGVLIAVEGAGAVFLVFAVAVAGSMRLVAPLPRLAPPPVPDGADERPGGALAALRQEPGGLALTAVIGLQFVAIGAVDVLFVVIAVEVLGVAASNAGFLNAAFGIGGVLGGLGGLWLVGRRRLVPPLLGAAVAWGAAFLAIAAWPTVGGAFVLLAAAGTAWTMLDVSARTLMQRTMPAEVRARVFGLLEGMSMLSLAFGSLLVPVLAALGGAEAALAGIGGLLVAAGVTSSGVLAALDRRAVPALRELAVLRASSLFDALSPPVLEDLARSLVLVREPAGAVLTREGEPGDRFFLVAEGTLSCTVGGEEVNRLGPGDAFGEIALLRDGIRTSTMTAREPVVLYALERGPFLDAVTGFAHVRRAAEGLAEQRLAAHR